MTLSVVCWKWGPLFSATYVNRLRAALERHLHLSHQLYCVTDDAKGIDARVRIVALPPEYRNTPRCRRRMRIFDRAFASQFGPRILSIDLDVVIVDDITPLVDRPEPLVGWRVPHAGVISGSFLLMQSGLLHPLWALFNRDPLGFPMRVQPLGVPSDQAMLNWYLGQGPLKCATWTDADGLVSYYGAGYERHEHLGVGPTRPQLPPGARIVVLGSSDKAVMDRGAYPWIKEHWRDDLKVTA